MDTNVFWEVSIYQYRNNTIAPTHDPASVELKTKIKIGIIKFTAFTAVLGVSLSARVSGMRVECHNVMDSFLVTRNRAPTTKAFHPMHSFLPSFLV